MSSGLENGEMTGHERKGVDSPCPIVSCKRKGVRNTYTPRTKHCYKYRDELDWTARTNTDQLCTHSTKHSHWEKTQTRTLYMESGASSLPASVPTVNS